MEYLFAFGVGVAIEIGIMGIINYLHDKADSEDEQDYQPPLINIEKVELTYCAYDIDNYFIAQEATLENLINNLRKRYEAFAVTCDESLKSEMLSVAEKL